MSIPYRIIESHLQGKSREAPRACEDVIVTTPGFVAIFDGATSKGATTLGGLTGGAFAARSLATGLEALAEDVDVQTAVIELTHRLAAALESEARPYASPPCATGIIYSVAQRQVWRVGDANCSINGQPHPGEHALDLYTAGLRAAYLQCLVAAGAEIEELRAHDPGRELIMPVLDLQHQLRNIDDPRFTLAYGAFDGRPIPDRFVEVFEVGPEPVHVVLTSDGYPQLAPTLDQAEAHLASVLATDPLMMSRVLATKGVGPYNVSYDDRAYVRFAVDAVA